MKMSGNLSYDTKFQTEPHASRPTDEYAAYQFAYDYFNGQLFAGQLPPCLITLQRQAHSYGYFAPRHFIARTGINHRTDEIALNPDTFAECTDKDILSTLVHEMAHLWQAHFGQPGRGRYHNRQWAREMMRLGLRPISFDNPGKMTGQRVSHEIISGGLFDVAADWLLATNFRLRWQSAIMRLSSGNGAVMPAPVELKPSKMKFTCPDCGQNAWAKPMARLICGRCNEPMTRRELL